MGEPNELVTISRPTTPIDAEILRDFLVQHGFDARLTGVAPTQLGAIFGFGPFSQRIQVPRLSAEAAIEAMSALNEYDAVVDGKADTLGAPVTTPPLAPRLKRIAAAMAFVGFPLFAGVAHYYARNWRAASILCCLSILSMVFAGVTGEGIFMVGMAAAVVADFFGSFRAVDVANGISRTGFWSAIQARAPLLAVTVLVLVAGVPVTLKRLAPGWYFSGEMEAVCEGLNRCDLVADRSSSCTAQLRVQFDQHADSDSIRQLEACAAVSADAECSAMRTCSFGLVAAEPEPAVRLGFPPVSW